ncbi:alpha/beta fold hydrolase [Microbacterium sp. 69-10]|uniref:alpha/beta fold hydrolase n=1 Tax=Microbacterium sp. 69-10 TaxID=1895783 RepID=UPI0034461ED3
MLLHGFPEHWWQWRIIAPRIAAHGYRVICPDLRGSAWTEADASGMHRTIQRDDVLAILDALGIGRVPAVGGRTGRLSRA